MADHEISETSVPVGAEDKFLVFKFGHGRSLAPHSDDSIHLGEMLHRMKVYNPKVTPIFDLRGLEGYYEDIDTFIQSVGGPGSFVLISDSEVDAGWEESLRFRKLVPVRAKGGSIGTQLLTHEYFDSSAELYFDSIADVMTYDEAVAASYEYQFEDLCEFISSIHRHSLLVEFAMSVEANEIQMVPYHGHAVHNIETDNAAVIVGRPGAIAETTGAFFAGEIAAFERLFNNPETKERHIQYFLEQHPNFLRGLNYQNIYPQIVLQRDTKGALRPDFILEPYDDAFCDILDVKLPFQKLFVGRDDRATLAAGLHEVAAQLREYAAYFEDEKYRRFVREKYGLRVYRPRLIALVGRDMRQMTTEEFRRAITVYDNLQFITFDELLKHAQRRILI